MIIAMFVISIIFFLFLFLARVTYSRLNREMYTEIAAVAALVIAVLSIVKFGVDYF